LLAFVSRRARWRTALEDGLANPVAFFIVPLFAFANAGVSLAGMSAATFLQPITFGVAAGLFIGKQLGILGACWLGVKSGLAKLPAGTSWIQVYGVSLLCGIGFTISLFIGALAFSDETSISAAKLGVLAGSLLSGVAGWLVLSGPDRKGKPHDIASGFCRCGGAGDCGLLCLLVVAEAGQIGAVADPRHGRAGGLCLSADAGGCGIRGPRLCRLRGHLYRRCLDLGLDDRRPEARSMGPDRRGDLFGGHGGDLVAPRALPS
jgi:hypothetical protein